MHTFDLSGQCGLNPIWTVTCTVDDDPNCDDQARDAVCTPIVIDDIAFEAGDVSRCSLPENGGEVIASSTCCGLGNQFPPEPAAGGGGLYHSNDNQDPTQPIDGIHLENDGTDIGFLPDFCIPLPAPHPGSSELCPHFAQYCLNQAYQITEVVMDNRGAGGCCNDRLRDIVVTIFLNDEIVFISEILNPGGVDLRDPETMVTDGSLSLGLVIPGGAVLGDCVRIDRRYDEGQTGADPSTDPHQAEERILAFRNLRIFQDPTVVIDHEAPELTVPADITVECQAAGGTNVDFEVSATENLDAEPKVECDASSGDSFPLGDTVVTCTAVDSAGNEADVCTFTVSVVCGGKQRPGDFGDLGDSKAQEGVSDATDQLNLLEHLFNGLGLPPCEGSINSAANRAVLDVNDDNSVDMSDAVFNPIHLLLAGPAPGQGTDCIAVPDCPEVCE